MVVLLLNHTTTLPATCPSITLMAASFRILASVHLLRRPWHLQQVSHLTLSSPSKVISHPDLPSHCALDEPQLGRTFVSDSVRSGTHNHNIGFSPERLPCSIVTLQRHLQPRRPSFLWLLRSKSLHQCDFCCCCCRCCDYIR